MRYPGLIIVLLVGLAVRFFYLLEQPSFPYFHRPEVDSWFYHTAAQTMAAGDWSLGSETLRRSPGYFYFLGLVYTLFGDAPWAPRIVQILLGMGIVALVWDTARRLFGDRWALLPAALAALYGPYVYFEGLLLSATLGAFAVALLLWRTVVALYARQSAFRHWAFIGFIWGLCCVVRPNALLLLLPLAVACLQVDPAASPGRRARALLALLLFGTLAIMPVTLRNTLVAGEPVILTSHGGFNFYIGNGPGAHGSWRLPREIPGTGGPGGDDAAFHRVAEQERGRPLSELEADRYWYRRTAQAALEDPLRWLGLMARKLHLFWNGRELHNIYDYEFMRVVGTVIGAPLIQFAYIAPFGLLGSLFLLVRRREGLFLVLFNWMACAGVVLVYVTDRHRIPAVAGILLAGTAVAVEIARLVGDRRWRPLGVWATALALAVAVAVPVEVNKRFEQKYHLLATSWKNIGHDDFAEWAYLRSLEAKPDFLPSHRDLASLYERRGLIDRALHELRTVERIARKRGDARIADDARMEIERLEKLAHPRP